VKNFFIFTWYSQVIEDNYTLGTFGKTSSIPSVNLINDLSVCIWLQFNRDLLYFINDVYSLFIFALSLLTTNKYPFQPVVFPPTRQVDFIVIALFLQINSLEHKFPDVPRRFQLMLRLNIDILNFFIDLFLLNN